MYLAKRIYFNNNILPNNTFLSDMRILRPSSSSLSSQRQMIRFVLRRLSGPSTLFIPFLDRGRQRESANHDIPIGQWKATSATCRILPYRAKSEDSDWYSLWNLVPRTDKIWCSLWRLSFVALSCLSRARACSLTSMSAEQHTSPPLFTLPHTFSSFAANKKETQVNPRYILTNFS